MQRIGKSARNILFALLEFECLTAEQLTRLCYSSGSKSFVRSQLKVLVESGLAMTVGGRGTGLPLIYTLTGTGHSLAGALRGEKPRRFRLKEYIRKQQNLFFMQHTLAVNDVLISARRLSQTRPDILLTRLYREPELRRKIYVAVPERLCIEPDGSLEFLITPQDTSHKWEDFFHIELYRTLPPVAERFKQKIQGYITYVDSGQHEALFQTTALSIAVIAKTERMAQTLRRWTEEVLAQMGRVEDGDWFFFTSINPAEASPEELFLTPVWESAFGTGKTPLIVLE